MLGISLHDKEERFANPADVLHDYPMRKSDEDLILNERIVLEKNYWVTLISHMLSAPNYLLKLLSFSILKFLLMVWLNSLCAVQSFI